MFIDLNIKYLFISHFEYYLVDAFFPAFLRYQET